MEDNTPMCKKCFQQHYNFRECLPRQDLKPPVKWGTKHGWGNDMGELKHNGGNTFLNKREGER